MERCPPPSGTAAPSDVRSANHPCGLSKRFPQVPCPLFGKFHIHFSRSRPAVHFHFHFPRRARQRPPSRLAGEARRPLLLHGPPVPMLRPLADSSPPEHLASELHREELADPAGGGDPTAEEYEAGESDGEWERLMTAAAREEVDAFSGPNSSGSLDQTGPLGEFPRIVVAGGHTGWGPDAAAVMEATVPPYNRAGDPSQAVWSRSHVWKRALLRLLEVCSLGSCLALAVLLVWLHHEHTGVSRCIPQEDVRLFQPEVCQPLPYTRCPAPRLSFACMRAFHSAAASAADSGSASRPSARSSSFLMVALGGRITWQRVGPRRSNTLRRRGRPRQRPGLAMSLGRGRGPAGPRGIGSAGQGRMGPAWSEAAAAGRAETERAGATAGGVREGRARACRVGGVGALGRGGGGAGARGARASGAAVLAREGVPTPAPLRLAARGFMRDAACPISTG